MRHHIALAPRPWLTRQAGECAWPVDGEGWTTRSCCNPCPGAAYCLTHRRMISRLAKVSMREQIAHLRALGLCG